MTLKQQAMIYMRGWSDAAGCLPMGGYENDASYNAGWNAGKLAREVARTEAEKHYGVEFAVMTQAGKDSDE